ncbi:MAG: hypothetical protein NC336_09530, partial [Clostridium sp.]|nr:hypothetical protein [Clostridium sp.]
EWLEEQLERKEQIYHYVNSDMLGIPASPRSEARGNGLSMWEKVKNSGLYQLITAPIATFEQFMRSFGSRSANGEGYLFDHFVRGWMDCRDREWASVKADEAILDEKAKQMGFKRWSDLYQLTKKRGATVSAKYLDGTHNYSITQGNLMYIYMANKMTDGRMKLAKMQIDINMVEQALDPRLRQLADWIQEDYLPTLRGKFNDVHRRAFANSSLNQRENQSVGLATLFRPLRGTYQTGTHHVSGVDTVACGRSLWSTQQYYSDHVSGRIIPYTFIAIWSCNHRLAQTHARTPATTSITLFY